MNGGDGWWVGVGGGGEVDEAWEGEEGCMRMCGGWRETDQYVLLSGICVGKKQKYVERGGGLVQCGAH